MGTGGGSLFSTQSCSARPQVVYRECPLYWGFFDNNLKSDYGPWWVMYLQSAMFVDFEKTVAAL